MNSQHAKQSKDNRAHWCACVHVCVSCFSLKSKTNLHCTVYNVETVYLCWLALNETKKTKHTYRAVFPTDTHTRQHTPTPPHTHTHRPVPLSKCTLHLILHQKASEVEQVLNFCSLCRHIFRGETLTHLVFTLGCNRLYCTVYTHVRLCKTVTVEQITLVDKCTLWLIPR